MEAIVEGGVDPSAEEVAGRRLLAINAGWCAAVGTGLVVGGGTASRGADMPAWIVRLLGATTVVFSGSVLVGSLAEDWTAPARRLVAVNAVAGAGLLGVALTRGTRRGRVAAGLLAAQVGVLSRAHVAALVGDQRRQTR